MALLLILRLQGVMQSWGTHSRWDSRDSGLMPSKSGVIGLLACARGLRRGDKRILEMEQQLMMGVRADKSGELLTDYQTVTRMEGNLLAAKGGKRTMPGKPSDAPDTILTPRQYLHDACFTVALAGNEDLLHTCADALQAPVWQLYLGRKSCVPSYPVFDCLTDQYQNVEQALSQHRLWKMPASAFCRCEIDKADGHIMRQDKMLETGVTYGFRHLNIVTLQQKGCE